jgi:hypothetical protein
MDGDAYPEQEPTPEAVVDALVEQLAALDLAMTNADLSGASIEKLHTLLGLASAAEEASDRVFVAVVAANTAS